MESPLKLETLNTTYVSLSGLIRYLRENDFRGRLHVVLDGYEADVFLYGSEPPSVWEKDLSSGRESRGEEAQQRLIVRSREPGGLITIYEGSSETVSPVEGHSDQTASESDSAEELDSTHLIESSAEVIAAVERAVQSENIEFGSVFRLSRIELGDDYPIIDPTAGEFEYADGKVVLTTNPSAITWQQALVGCLKRVVDQVARNTEEVRFRERVAVELAIAARRQTGGLGGFESQLDRIAGTQVL